MGENNEVDYIDNNQNVRQVMLARHKILLADKVQIICDINSEKDAQRTDRVRRSSSLGLWSLYHQVVAAIDSQGDSAEDPSGRVSVNERVGKMWTMTLE